MMLRILAAALLALPTLAGATIVETFRGEAREKGVHVYTEMHEVTKDSTGRPLEAVTTYVNPQGTTLGVLRSDFRNSLNLPDHVFEDAQSKVKYGIRRRGTRIEMFNQQPGKPENTRELEAAGDAERLQVGCQGFNYYLFGNVDKIKARRVLPVLFMIPGDLSTYKFELQYVREDPDRIVDFTVAIENRFLRLFVHRLEFRYDRKINRIVWYKGLSNIKNDRGRLMDVVIEYTY